MGPRVRMIFLPVLSNVTFIGAITEVIAGGKERKHFISHLSLTLLDSEHGAQLKEHRCRGCVVEDNGVFKTPLK